MSRALAPSGGNDRVYTPDYLASHVVNHFRPAGRIMEPCRGGGAFTSILQCDWCELDDGVDFLADQRSGYDWVVTNPPWSKFRVFLQKSMLISDNVVFVQLLNATFMKARLRDIIKSGFGVREALLLKTPSKPWPQTGFQLAAVHYKRGYVGPIIMSGEAG